MSGWKRNIWLAFLLVLVVVCSGCAREPEFVLGADVSSLIALENSGVSYYDADGNSEELLKILRDAGMNYVRVRVWVDPYDSAGNGYGGGNCDLENAIAIGKRASAYGMGLLVDFHYSDFWADPGKQQVPKAWQNLNFDEKKQAIFDYTVDSIQQIRSAGITVGMVQIGNETTAGFCGEYEPEGQYPLMAAAAEGVRAADPEILIAVHYTNPESLDYGYFVDQLAAYGVDYDIFSTSYYPCWHGSLENLKAQLQTVIDRSGKKVMIAETAWAYTAEDSDDHPNSVTAQTAQGQSWPLTVQGQAQYIRDVIGAMESFGEMAVGVFYWEPGWIAVPGENWEERSRLWETHGSGWASSFAGEYDPEDAGRWYGGSACDNQALFDETGRALESLGAFNRE